MINKQIDSDKLNFSSDILAKALFSGSLTKYDYIHSFDLILQSAEQGNMEAQFRLADLYALGQGIQKSQVKAYQWYTKAALQGYKKALIRIHNLYQQDKRVYCRGQLNSKEKGWADIEFKKKNNIRELNEYRREQHVNILNNAVDYYTEQFKHYKSSTEENMEFDLNLAFLYQYGYGTRKNIILAFDFYKKTAERGHKDAQRGLAYLYQTSSNMKFNYRLALRWYRASATNGNVAAQNCLAYFYEKGLATEQSYEGALYWYTIAAHAGSPSAQLALGRLYRKGQGIEQNLLEAIKWYKLAADQGNSAAQNCLNRMHLTGKIPIATNRDSVSQSPVTFTLCSKLQKDITYLTDSKNIKQLKKLAQHAFMTDGSAMYQIGLKYYNGEDFSQDKDTGFQWIKKAAKAGLEEAGLKVAKMYEDGDVVDQDYHKSSIWTIKTANKRNNTALLKLGILYKNGLGVRKDPLEASKWFLKSADQGNIKAKFQFGLLKYYGEGVREDKEEAFDYFYKSALLGNADALYQLGCMYENNQFMEIDIYKVLKMYKSAGTVEHYDPTGAIKFYKSASSLGSYDAHFRLARIYEEGKLTSQNLLQSNEYYTMAANSDNPYYQTELALKYINGDFKDIDYTRAFDLFKKAAEKNEPRAICIFRTPIGFTTDIKDYSKVINMFMLASTRGVEGVDYNIAHAYEHGITFERRKPFSSNYINTKVWYSIAARRGDSRAKYRIEAVHEQDERVEKYQSIASCFYSLPYENGNSDVAYHLALMYLRGKHVSQNYIKAFNLLTSASNMGHEKARQKLMLSKYSGNLEMLKAVANSGNLAIQYQLGIYFEDKNNSNSIKWLTLAADGGISDACYRLGVLYEEGTRSHTNCLKAIELYKKAIKKDHKYALYRLAQIYNHGKGDYIRAYDLYTRAADLGHSSALKVLNIIGKQSLLSQEKVNEEALDYSTDEINNISMLKFVAKQGDVNLQFKLGYFYENNEDNQDYLEAFKWYEMAADKNHTEAIYRLGLFYEYGLGVKQDYRMSIQLYNQAKNQGDDFAIYRLGIAFHRGHGVDQNPTEAVNCYTDAAKLGNHEAQYTLGKLYETGEFIQRDIMKALVLYTEAYINGNIDVVQSLYNLYDDQPYENFFHQNLFQILLKFEKSNNTNSDDDQIAYGYMYYRLGIMYLEGTGIKKDGAAALKSFLKAEIQYGYNDAKPFTTFRYNKYKDKKDVYIQRMQAYFDIKDIISSERQYRIGIVYYEDAKRFYEEDQIMKNNTVPFLVASREDDTAYQYLLLAANNNHTNAQYQLGIMYILGRGVQQNEEMAIEWIKKSVEATEYNQCYEQGMGFYNGNGVCQNYKLSYIYIKKAAKENDRKSQARLGIMYYQGLGVEQNHDEAMKWLEESTNGMEKDDYYNQGMEFYRDVNIDNAISLIYIIKAVKNNHIQAKAQLGAMYYLGYGVRQSRDEAMEWFKQSIKEMKLHQCYEQGMEFYQGKKFDKNYEIALLYIETAARINYSKAQAQLGMMYFHGHGVNQNHEEAIKLIQKSIKEMNKCKCYKQGMEICKNITVDKDYGIALLYIREAAEKNHGGAQAQLGSMYFHGYGVEQNHEKAIKWIKQAVKKMDKNKCYKKGMDFYHGIKVNKNYEIALLYIREATEKNHGCAQAQLGSMYFHGYGVEQNHEKAIKWIKQAVKKMDKYKCYDLGMEFYQGIKVDQNYKIALLYIRKAAGENHFKSQAQLGMMYFHGHGVEKNHEETRKWIHQSIKKMNKEDCYKQGMGLYRDFKAVNTIVLLYIKKAAKDNHAGAQAQLGLFYLKGRGVEKNLDKAIEWIELSVKHMSPYECYSYGINMYSRSGIDQNHKLSLMYLRNAAEKGHIYSQAQLGHMYLNISDINRDCDEAARWYSKAVDGYPHHPAYSIGQIYHYDNRGIQDFSKALEWYHRESGHIEVGFAMYGIGLLYEYGDGVSQDYRKAFEYYEQAAKSDDLGGCYSLGLLYYHGKGVEQSYAGAFSFFNKTIKNKHSSDEMYVLIEDTNANSKGDVVELTCRNYSLQPRSRIRGEAYYYIGLMYENGYGRVQSKNEARVNFKKAFKLGLKRAVSFLK